MTGETQVPMQLGYDLMSYQTGDIGKINLKKIEIPSVSGQPAINNFAYLNIYHFVFSYPQLPSYCYTEYDTDMGQLTKEQILKRMVVIKNFLFYPKSTIEAITQLKIQHFDTLDFFCVCNVVVYIRDAFCHQFNCTVNAGFWYQNCSEFPAGYQCSFGFDIISLHTYLLSYYKRQYSQSVDELYDYFNSRNFIHRSVTLHPKEFYVQEKNPISIFNPAFFDRFFEKFTVNSITRMGNSHGRTIGCVWDITTKYNERMDVYYTFWRHNESTQYSILPLPPQPPYDLNFLVNECLFQGKPKDIFICNAMCDIQTGDVKGSTYRFNHVEILTPAFLYGDLKNLLNANLSGFSGCRIYFNAEKWMSQAFFKLLARKFKESGIEKCTILPYYDDPFAPLYATDCPLDELINNPENYKLKRVDSANSITDVDAPIPGADRKRVMLLDPVIESATITWIFSQEKVGKTLLALSIAQKIGKGNSEIGTWRSLDPKKVLYIDGEMPGDKLKSHIDRIIRGSGDDPEVTQRAFRVYLFAEHDFDYWHILDEKWQSEHLDELMEYDLIILDNYYTLHESLNAIPLIRWMKKLTRKGIAFLVLDHTNSEGDLQGSKVKKRAMDLGLKLELLNKNEISIDFQCDRYGREHDVKKFNLIPFFAAMEFSYATKIIDKMKGADVEKTLEQIAGEDIDLVAIFVLKKQDKQNKEVAEQLGMSSSQITKKLQKIGRNAKFEEISQSSAVIEKFKEIEEKAQQYLTATDESAVLDLIELARNRAKG